MERLSSSFRDPCGFVFEHEGVIFRQINKIAKPAYDRFVCSGLYSELVQRGWLVSHEEVSAGLMRGDKAYRVIRPEQIEFISYPYEWCFSQYKDAALLTLDIQLLAMDYGMTLKDASAFNVQFVNGRPIFIDSLSFDNYKEGEAWDGYRQFCQHFLGPISLMSRIDIGFGRMLRIYIDGIPLGLISKMLPVSTWFDLSLLMHIHLHARAQRIFSKTAGPDKSKVKRSLSKNGLVGILQSLRRLISRLEWKPEGTEWVSYYDNTNYTEDSFGSKLRMVEGFLDEIQPSAVWDLGANTGLFSLSAVRKGISTIAFDIDPAAVEINYLRLKDGEGQDILPLVMDLSNPSSGLGWAGKERMSLSERGPVDCVMALALIHHLVIGNNISLDRLAGFLAPLCNHLVIEFIPKTDSQVARLLRSRKDIFDEYDEATFELVFGAEFLIREKLQIPGSERKLYLMSRKASIE